MANKRCLVAILLIVATAIKLRAVTSMEGDNTKEVPNSTAIKSKRSDTTSVFANLDHSIDLFSTTNQYLNSQAQKFRVNVSNVCDKNHMKATIRLNKPFYGIIHAKDRRKKPNCVIEGNGDQTYVLDLSYTQVQSEPEFCGVMSHPPAASQRQNSTSMQLIAQSTDNLTTPTISSSVQLQQPTLSIVLVVRLHKTIEFSEDRYFLLSCINRCARPDCSARYSNSNSPVSQAHRSSSHLPASSDTSESRQSVSPLQATDLAALQEPCDQSNTSTHGNSFKLQWLVKICIILTILFISALASALYLCFVLNKSKRDRVMGQRMIAKQADPLESALATSDSYVVPSTTRSESLSWTATSGSNGDAVDETQLIDAAKDDNSIMVKQQHKRFLLANGLIAHEQDQDVDIVSRQQQPQQQSCLTLDNNHRIIHQPVFGRSAIDQLERMKRRRSIGSSMVLARESTVNKLAGKTLPSNNVHFDDRQRAKSRSQTTIYYGQSQDPFKAIPFNNNQSSANLGGFFSDGTNMVNPNHQQRSTRVLEAPPIIAEIYSDYDKFNQQNRHHFNFPSNTINTAYLKADHGNKWSLTNGHRNAPPPPPSRTHLLPVSHHAGGGGIKLTSQFDPRNSTQQLSDLIQQKHQQHIEQANMTKTSLQSPTTLDPFDNDRVIWK